MNTVKVQYKVTPEYASQNKNNIQKVMSTPKKIPFQGIFCSTSMTENDPLFFVHLDIAKDAETKPRLNTQETFTKSTTELKTSGLTIKTTPNEDCL